MFANLKNKIKEEIGSDVSTLVRSVDSVRALNRHLSQSTIGGSQISLDDPHEDGASSPVQPPSRPKRENSFDLKLADGTPLSAKDVKKLENREDEWRRRLQKREAELLKRMEKKEEEHRIRMLEKEKEWKKIVDKHEKEKAKLVEDRLKAESAKDSLEVALNHAEEYKKKLYNFQEDAEQMEGFQVQEMAKIKHLLLAKEQECEDKSQRLKSNASEIESLKTELARLRRYENELNDVQDEMESLRHTTQRERAQLSSQLAKTEEEVRHLKDKLFVLEQRVALEPGNESSIDDRVADLMRERALLERKLEETHLHLSDIKTSWAGKISSLETQVGRLSRQVAEESHERRRVEKENETLKQRVKELEAEAEVNNVEVSEQNDLIQKTTSALENKQTELFRAASNYQEEKSRNLALQLEVDRLKEELENEKVSKKDIHVNLEKERTEKDSALLRTALISQEIQIVKQKAEIQELENMELQNRLELLEHTLKDRDKNMHEVTKRLDEAMKRIEIFEKGKVETESRESNEILLKNNLSDLEEQLNEKNKTIKILQQRLADMKKTLQRELKVVQSTTDSEVEPSAAILDPSSSKTVSAKQSNTKEDHVNFEYLKHVLIKFLTSREYEALHLTRAVATLLHFSPEEERLLQETLEWKMSWFGSRPNLGIGQTAKAIPPS
ncbi:hypothetical protein QAD02_015258 [Eretmocerus hayati]|uniref:Uncharacterized protein n=1 Tax=Eretmocerus hayati TaxID=131215 RepID=A0ACC2P8Y9_9HYME|nr:hypothetical protein QAD02_015258 [Eretmocerus hayati]